MGYAYSSEDLGCPSDTGLTWIYSDGASWLDAGEGILINCYNSTCSQESPCANGEGDCDDASDCVGSLVCGNDNCEAGPRGLDCCTSTCHNDSDCINQECNNGNNHCRLDSYSSDWSKCNHESQCAFGEGDCDDDSDCEGSFVCGTDNCVNGPPFLDCCENSENKIYKGKQFTTISLIFY